MGRDEIRLEYASTPVFEVLLLAGLSTSAYLPRLVAGSASLCAVEVTIGYDAPWRHVRDLLLAAAASTTGIRADPAPTVRQAALDDFYVRYELLFSPDIPNERIPIIGRLHEAIQDRFQEAGLQIMSPHYHSDPASPKVPAALGRV